MVTLTEKRSPFGEKMSFNIPTPLAYQKPRYYNPNTASFTTLDPFDGDAQSPQSFHKYLYCHADPVNSIDPTGMWSMGSVGTAMGIGMRMAATSGWASLTTGGTLAKITTFGLATGIIGGGIYWANGLVDKWTILASAQFVPTERLKAAETQIATYWSGNNCPRMAKLLLRMQNGTGQLKVKYIPGIETNGVQGYNTRLTTYLYVSGETIAQEDPLALALVIFAEFQHAEGEDLNEIEAEEEFVRVRNMLPWRVRTAYINSLSHGEH